MTAALTVTSGRHARRMPGEEGIWVFVFGDMMMFSLFFVIFLHDRARNVELFAQSQSHLNQAFGALNMVFMLSSSWFVAMAVQAARRNLARLTPVLLVMAFACGFGFGVVKMLEYAEKLHAGITLTTNDFYMYYYIFTGIHFVHVMLGMAVLAFLARRTGAAANDEHKMRNLESGASFWHLVDLLWIVLFALFYLIK